MILVDTSVWVSHLRRRNARLANLLEQGLVTCHPFVTGELACTGLRDRGEILTLLAALPQAPQADHHEVMHLITSADLAGSGIGWVDAHLLASARLMSGRLWTRDGVLADVAERLGVGDATRV